VTRLALVLLAPFGFQCPDVTHVYDADVAATRAAWSDDEALPADDCGSPRVVTQRLTCDTTCYADVQAGDTIYIDDRFDEVTQHSAARHGAVHWLAWCTGYQVNGDPGHSMPELWGADGVLERAEVP